MPGPPNGIVGAQWLGLPPVGGTPLL